MYKDNYDPYDSKNVSDLTMEKNSHQNKDVVIQPNDLGVAPQQITGGHEQPVNIAGSNDNNAHNSHNAHNEHPVIQESNFETLDESVCDTLKRDLKRIIFKIEHVLLPRFSATKGREIQNWDLWGPLLITLTLCITCAFSGDKDFEERGSVFIIIFVIVWIGGFVISLNSQFLGAKINYFQSLCLLGYCIFPIDIAAIIIRVVSSARFVKIIVVAVALIWSCFSSVGFMSGMVQPEKKMVAVYPVFLFFLVLSWFVLDL